MHKAAQCRFWDVAQGREAEVCYISNFAMPHDRWEGAGFASPVLTCGLLGNGSMVEQPVFWLGTSID